MSKKNKIKKDKSTKVDESLKVSSTTKDSGGSVLPELETETSKISAPQDKSTSNITSSIGEIIATSTGGVGKTQSAPKQDRNFGKSGKRDGNHEFRSKNGNSKKRGDFKSGKFEQQKHTTIEPTDSKSNKFIQIGDLYQKRENKTLLDYALPTQMELNLLVSSPMLSPYEDRYQEMVNINLRRVQNSPYIGDLVLIRQAIKDTTKLHFTIFPYLTGVAKGDDTIVSVGFYTNESRILELNQPRVTLQSGKLTDMFGDSITLDDQAQGASVSGYPNSSLADNDIIRLPYTAQVLDEIYVVDLDGGAFIRKGNLLERTIAWDGSSHYIIPGATGYNYYASNDDRASGKLTPHYKKVQNYRGIKHILVGDEFTSSKTKISLSSNISSQTNAVINTDGYFGQASLSLSDKEKQGGSVNSYDYFNKADLQFAVLSNDYLKYYSLHIKNMNDTSGDNPTRDRLAGFLDKQAFYYALASGVRFGTFMRCLLYAFDQAWITSPFIATKTGVMPINDQFLRNMPPMGRKGRTDFLTYLKTVLPQFPYNKNAYEAFKEKCKSSMLTDKADVYAENNPVVGFRVVFSAMEDVGLIEQDNVLDFTKTILSDRSILFPHTSSAQVASATSGGKEIVPSVISDLTNLNVNPFGTYVKSLITQIPLWVPHGDLLSQFINYFKPYLFYSRLTDAFPAVKINGISGETLLKSLLEPTNTISSVLETITADGGAKRSSLTTIFDPKNMTGFLANFISYGFASSQMEQWVRAALTINQPFYMYMKELYKHHDNKETGNATIAFSDEVEFNFKQEDEQSIVAAPKYQVSVINSLIYQTRIYGAVKALGTGVTLSLTNVGPFMPNQTYRNVNLNLADLLPSDNAQLPRVSLSVASNTSNYSFGVKGDILYDGQAPWARSNSIQSNMYSSALISLLNSRWKKLLMSGAFIPNTVVSKPEDLYNLYYYPSFSTFAYKPVGGIQIVPGYDYDYHNPNLFSAIIKTITDEGFWGGRKDESFNYLNPVTGDYEEIYDVDEWHGDTFIASHPAASSIRLIYGSMSRKLVKPAQWVTSVAPGSSNSAVLKSRYNAVSIFTANNVKTIGIANSSKHLDDMNNSATYYYLYYTQVFQDTFGFLSNPFIEIGSGGSLPLNVHSQVTPYYNYKTLTSDMDLSIRFGNIDNIVLGLRAGLKDGETYPVVSGFGHDIIGHPGDQKSYHDPFGAESPKTK